MFKYNLIVLYHVNLDLYMYGQILVLIMRVWFRYVALGQKSKRDKTDISTKLPTMYIYTYIFTYNIVCFVRLFIYLINNDCLLCYLSVL